LLQQNTNKHIDTCKSNILTSYRGSWDYEYTVELLENLLEHILVDIDSGLDSKKRTYQNKY